MAKTTILLRSGRTGEPTQKEYTASGAITPGHLVEFYSAADTVRVHSNAGQDAATMFAINDSLQGQEIGDAYTTANRVQVIHAAPGDEIYALLADGQTASIGSFLESAGDGTLNVHTAPASNSDGAFDEGGESIYTRAIVGVAMEAVDLSASANTAAGRIMICVL